ncbi:MAG TPA: hypothetical protein VJ825_05600 [Gemmatimonadaceae bacterium]|nr:hypothetical protein [Gemmatimonadaceae bacterium]
MRRNWLGRAVVALAVAAAVLPLDAGAQSCSASGVVDNCGVPGSVTMTAGRVVRLEMSAGSTALSAPTPADFDAGFNSTVGPTLTVSANAPWTLQIRAGSATWTASNTSPGAPARVNKPATDLLWSVVSTGSFTPLSSVDTNLVTGLATASSATTLYFQTLYDWTADAPGNYSLAIVLTLTSP